MLIVPNIIWSRNKPKNYEKYVVNENKFLLVLERIGEVLVSCCALISSDFNIHKFTLWSLWLPTSLIFMVLYEAYWIRYFKSEKTMKDFYSSFFGIPVAGATLPIIGFLILGLYGKNILLMISVLILGIGHIGIHINHKKEIYKN